MNDNDTKKPDPSVVHRARKMATIIGACAIIALIAMGYAFVQREVALKNAEEAFRQRVLAEESQNMAMQNAEEAKRQAAIANELRVQLSACVKTTR